MFSLQESVSATEVLRRKESVCHTCWREDVRIWEFIKVRGVVNAFDLDGNGSRSLSTVRRKTVIVLLIITF